VCPTEILAILILVATVEINGVTVLTNFDIFQSAGAMFKAVIQEFTNWLTLLKNNFETDGPACRREMNGFRNPMTGKSDQGTAQPYARHSVVRISI
jgi:hypothetical protein